MKTNTTLIPVFTLLFCVSTFLYAQNNYVKTVNEINDLLEDEFFSKSIISINAYDLTAKKSILKKNEKLLLHPASNQKVVTTAAALYFLGTDFTFNTSIYHTGEIIDGTCYGDIYIEGGCDPDFTTMDMALLIESLKDSGIKKIDGNIYGDISMLDSLQWGKGWMWDDDPFSDFPRLSPLTINDACVKFMVQPNDPGQPVKIDIEPESAFYKFSNNSRTTDSDSSSFKITRDWVNGTNTFSATGLLPEDEEADTLIRNIVQPENYFLTLFREALYKNDIVITGSNGIKNLPAKANLIYTHKRKFADVINNLNKESDNLSAEMTLRALAFERSGKPASPDSGIAMIDSLLSIAGLDADTYRIVDGSGVSHYNLISTELETELLKYFYFNRYSLYKVLYDSFPIAGVDGTLEKRMMDGLAFNNVHAKTGTLSGVSCLSGYLTAENNNMITFSIFIQNYVGSDKTARNYIDKICEILCEIE